MKLRFSIHYRTEWGQQMQVSLKCLATDGYMRSSEVPMTTADGDYWQAEISVVESRRSPLSSFIYYYKVVDASGFELRREWDEIPRTYLFDSSKMYTMVDQWRDRPLPYHLYSRAYAVTTRQRVDEFGLLREPLYRKTVMFRVSAPQLQTGQSVALIGSHPSMGAWNPTRYLPMKYAGRYEWMLTLNADMFDGPIEFKYVLIDEQTHQLLSWEEGDNRMFDHMPVDGEVLVIYGAPLRLAEKTWRAAGISVPVFSLRSEHSYGVGDFGDLYRLVEWVEQAGLRIIQLLPVNDTTVTHHWGDSYPYNIVSAFALHPHYIDLEQLGNLQSEERMTVYRRRQRELNALDYSDYEAVDRVKSEYLSEFYAEQGQETLTGNHYKEWQEANKLWLEPYAEWLAQRESEQSTLSVARDTSFVFFIQYHLHLQLKRASDYARSKGISLKGDLPIGINFNSVETALHPNFFHLDSQIGTPPDAFDMQGQNWGFPTYNWESAEQKNPALKTGKGTMDIVDWFRARLCHMEQYFDALRIDHVLGFFRVWEIPACQLYGTMGHFSPAMPLTPSEIENFGLPFRRDLLTHPFINDRVIERLFGIHAQYVRDSYLTRKAYGLYELKPEVDTQLKIRQLFEGQCDENSLWIRDGLYRLVSNVLFIEDDRNPDTYHPRISAYQEPVFEALSADERDAYMRLYNNFFFQRHSMYWKHIGYQRLNMLLRDTHMLICAEDLGVLPDCVAPVLDALRILTLEIQLMPKLLGQEFAHLDGNPVRSVATISTHDMSPLRLWWTENQERAQRFYTTMLQKQGRAPEVLPPHLAEEVIARHLYSPSMLCVFSLQDWLAMDSELRSKNVRSERINVPSNPMNRWQWRMHLTIEQLLEATRFTEKMKTMITRSKRSL